MCAQQSRGKGTTPHSAKLSGCARANKQRSHSHTLHYASRDIYSCTAALLFCRVRHALWALGREPLRFAFPPRFATSFGFGSQPCECNCSTLGCRFSNKSIAFAALFLWCGFIREYQRQMPRDNELLCSTGHDRAGLYGISRLGAVANEKVHTIEWQRSLRALYVMSRVKWKVSHGTAHDDNARSLEPPLASAARRCISLWLWRCATRSAVPPAGMCARTSFDPIRAEAI